MKARLLCIAFLCAAFSARGHGFDIIPTNQHLYCVNYHDSGDSFILKLDARWLTNYVGDLLITQAGEATGVQPKLFIVSWDNATSCLNARRISLPDSIGGRFEHVTFAPIKLSTQ